MGIYCQKCETLHKGSTLFRKCPTCGNTDITKFIRADEADFDPKVHEKVRKYLESRRL